MPPRLRAIARVAGFALPALLTLVALIGSGGTGALGLVVERWLFFAEAKHTVTLYYGSAAV